MSGVLGFAFRDSGYYKNTSWRGDSVPEFSENPLKFLVIIHLFRAICHLLFPLSREGGGGGVEHPPGMETSIPSSVVLEPVNVSRGSIEHPLCSDPLPESEMAIHAEMVYGPGNPPFLPFEPEGLPWCQCSAPYSLVDPFLLLHLSLVDGNESV